MQWTSVLQPLQFQLAIKYEPAYWDSPQHWDVPTSIISFFSSILYLGSDCSPSLQSIMHSIWKPPSNAVLGRWLSFNFPKRRKSRKKCYISCKTIGQTLHFHLYHVSKFSLMAGFPYLLVGRDHPEMGMSWPQKDTIILTIPDGLWSWDASVLLDTLVQCNNKSG